MSREAVYTPGPALLPQWFLRFALWLLRHSVYRVKVLGTGNLPSEGGALLVPNHMSFMDVLLLLAASPRPIRFLMFQEIYDLWLIRPFARMMRAIPVSGELRPRDKIRSLRIAGDAVRQGELVCVFAESEISRTGQMLPFRRGLERIMKGVAAPIIPVNLHGVWGSIFSFERNRFVWKVPRRVPYPVTVSFGKPLPPHTSAADVRRAVQDLGTAAFEADKNPRRTLDRALVRSARRYPRRLAMADARTPGMNFGSMLMKTIYVARRLRPFWQNQPMVGILLPPSVGGALTNHAATLLGLVPVNLNYTSSNEVIAACARQCNLQTVVTSKAFVEKMPNIEVPARALFLEDVLAAPKTAEKIVALLIAWLLPFALLKRALGATTAHTDDVASLIFSSGSTGDPKGVMLTHNNITANIRQMTQVFTLDEHDRILGILPFFHAFGFTVGLWLPAVHSVGVVFHPNPLDAQVIGELTEKYRITFLISTPSFLQAYMRRCTPQQFSSLETVLAGAEKLPDRVAVAFEQTYGIKPLEGYGCTECSPVVAVNVHDYRAPGFRQIGARRGTIGRPLPGVSVRIVDPDTFAPVPPKQNGMLLVRGPNLMQGYLNRPDKTRDAMHDGWYVTGDIGSVDDDGFITITDRLSRFSKIGGEMVPHIKVEETLHDLAGFTEQVLVVAALPDPRKGERLIVLHTLDDQRLSVVLDRLPESDLPPLWRPRKDQFYRVEALPYLGTGKLDMRAMKMRAREVAGGPA
ncbi:MAG TPA: AMP-binding protein [Terriglobales bacterium]|nr:AMP-binding protein [Terriglobales bacterium]